MLYICDIHVLKTDNNYLMWTPKAKSKVIRVRREKQRGNA